jgi:RNA polymerase sigma-70 factor (ECF subfamily)
MKEQISETSQDLESFEDQALPLASALLGAALSMTSNRAEAEDLVQETFLRAFRSWDSFEKGTNLKAWLFRILTNLYITSYRKRRREPTIVVPEDDSEFDLYQALGRPEDNSAEAVVMDSLVDEDVKSALTELPEDFRLTVLLADVEGFSYKEIAEIMNVPIGTVMSRLHRGRKALQKSLFELAQQRGFVSRDGAR